ncbi:MAG: hypothetical protein M1816_003981 [Peltula sp. TS41687]|nr:MAG: hypothetical protein M1816_003981 [Peltula sp. TS41687]
MASSASNPEPTWHWPDETRFRGDAPSSSSTNNGPSGSSAEKEAQPGKAPKPKHYPPRTCRICLETVLPTYEPNTGNLASLLSPSPSVSYASSDPTLGRLIRPCKCKGSSRYVHEGCLQAWRHADPAYGKRNFWQCPTCGFRYRLERMRWASWISSTGTQITLTLTILCLAMFLLGFIADPIINLYLDPYNTISSSVPLSRYKYNRHGDPIIREDEYDSSTTSWTEHFLKGLASLGLLSFIKVLVAMSPWQWWNLRNSGLMSGSGGRVGGSGRDRLASISWVVVLIGVGTFIWGVYKGVRVWSRRWLEKAGERVMDVQVDVNDDDDDDDGDVNAATASAFPTETKDQ